MKRICRVEHKGLTPYQEAWDYQNQLAERISSGQRADTLLLLEHPHTYTLGRRGQSENLLWSQERLKEKGISVHWVDRGGDITYHGPGQIVGYPILQLAPIGWSGDRLPQADFVGYIRKLEDVLICALSKFYIKGIRIEGKTGVWVRDFEGTGILKIASIGVKVDSKGITRHGFALNVNPDMTYWQGIIPCGLSQVQMTRMSAWSDEPVNAAQVSEAIVNCFSDVFDYRMINSADADSD